MVPLSCLSFLINCLFLSLCASYESIPSQCPILLKPSACCRTLRCYSLEKFRGFREFECCVAESITCWPARRAETYLCGVVA